MSKELVEKILNSYVEEVGTGAGKMLRAWTPAENELAEYAAELQAENARLTMLSGLLAASKIELVDRNSELQSENARLIAENKRLETAVKDGE